MPTVVDVTINLTGSGVIALDSDLMEFVPEFQMAVLDTSVKQAPSSITVTVDGGRPEVDIQFYLDSSGGGQDLATTTQLDTSGHLEPFSITITGALGGAQGTRTITGIQMASDGSTIMSSATYTVALAPNPSLLVIGADLQAIEVPGALDEAGVRHWVFQDLLGDDDGGIGSYVLPINPSHMDSPHQEYALKTHHTTSQDGMYHVFQSSQAGNFPKDFSFSGVADTQEFVEKLFEYRGLNRRFYIIDHHNRAWKSVIVNVDAVPRLRTNWKGEDTDWFHDYTVAAVIVDQTWVTPA